MGTVVEKFQYIEGTKQAIKKAIKNKGVDVSDTDTFRSYAEKIESIGGGGGSSVAEYVYENKTETVAFPRKPSTESTDYIFTDENAYKTSDLEFSCYEPESIERISDLFDGNLATNGNMINGFFFKFDKPVLLKKLYVYNSGGYEITLRGTNNPEIATTSYSDLWEVIYTGGAESYDIDLENKEYQYYYLSKNSGYKTIYELKFYAVVGSVKCTLKSANMTPSFKCYPEDYMQVITQDWHNGSEIIPSQTLTFKPYEDGGCLVNYNDDGKAVNLKMYYIDSQTGISQLQSWQQPVLSSNGEIGGDSFAVSSSSNVEDAWKAFDNDNNSYANKVDSNEYIIFYNPERLKISHIEQISSGDSYSPVNGELYYSDNGNDWFLSNIWNTNSYDVAETKGHKYWKILILQSNGTDNNDFTKINITAEEEALKHKFFVLSPDDGFVLDGDFEKTQVADLNIPERLS